MSYASLLNTTGTISRSTETGKDKLNRPIYTWAVIDTVDCRIEPADFKGDWETYNRAMEEAAMPHALLFLPYGTDIQENDKFTTGGVEYLIWAVASPTAGHMSGQGKHIEVWLRYWK